MICSTTLLDTRSSYWLGVADKKMHWLTRSEHLFERERPIVARRGQAETVLDEDVLAAAVARELPVELRNRDVTLVDHKEEVVGEVVEQGERRLAVFAAVDVHRVVLDAVAVSELAHHLEVVRVRIRSRCASSSLSDSSNSLSGLQLVLDLAHRPRHALVAGDVVGGGEHVSPFQLAQVLAGQRDRSW